MNRNSVYPSDQASKSQKDFIDEDLEQFLSIPNEDLSYRNTKYKLNGMSRIFGFYNAPIVKFMNHFVSFSNILSSKLYKTRMSF